MVNWTDNLVTKLLEILLELKAQKEISEDNSIHATSWKKIWLLFKEHLPETEGSSEWKKESLQSKLQNLKMKYTDLNKILSFSGMEWDAESCKPIASSDSVWSAYVAGQAEAQKKKMEWYTKHSFPHYLLLKEFFSGRSTATTATREEGSSSRSSTAVMSSAEHCPAESSTTSTTSTSTCSSSSRKHKKRKLEDLLPSPPPPTTTTTTTGEDVVGQRALDKFKASSHYMEYDASRRIHIKSILSMIPVKGAVNWALLYVNADGEEEEALTLSEIAALKLPNTWRRE